MKTLLLAAEGKAKWKELEETSVSSAKPLWEPLSAKVVEWKSKSMGVPFLLRDDRQKPVHEKLDEHFARIYRLEMEVDRDEEW